MTNNILDRDLPADRPTQRFGFFRTLCILSFIGVGLSVIGYTLSVDLYNGLSHSVYDGEKGARGIVNFIDNYVHVIALGIIANIFIFIAVLMMWKMKRTGYLLYTFTQILSIVGMGMLLEFAWPVIVSAIFALVFIILYGMYYKHMR